MKKQIEVIITREEKDRAAFQGLGAFTYLKMRFLTDHGLHFEEEELKEPFKFLHERDKDNQAWRVTYLWG